jgi:glycosyltransferase involved in cell wall biosynthesis
VIGYVGRFVPVKDLDTLVRSFALIAPRMPNAVLLLAGGGATRSNLEVLGTQLGVADRMKFVGWIDDLASLYAAMDVCCLSSINEGTPVALLEAMAAGKPVVATGVGGVVDVIEDGRTGLLVPAKDVEAFAGALMRLAADPVLRQQLGETARPAVGDTFSVERLSDNVDRMYQELLRDS